MKGLHLSYPTMATIALTLMGVAGVAGGHLALLKQTLDGPGPSAAAARAPVNGRIAPVDRTVSLWEGIVTVESDGGEDDTYCDHWSSVTEACFSGGLVTIANRTMSVLTLSVPSPSGTNLAPKVIGVVPSMAARTVHVDAFLTIKRGTGQ